MIESKHAIIEISQLKKTFFSHRGKSSVEAVRGINLEVQRGEIFGLLGPNGAGKSTTMRMVCTLLQPTEGSVHINDFDTIYQANQVRSCIGYVSQKGGMEPAATGRENLVLQAMLYGMSRETAQQKATTLMNTLYLTSFADRKTETYSGGQRRIFDIAAAIIHNPALLFLDEPTTGLDPQSRSYVWEQIRQLNKMGTTIFLTTHYLEEADLLCNRVAIVDHGTIIAQGNPQELKHHIADDIITLGFGEGTHLQTVQDLMSQIDSIKEVQIIDNMVHVYLHQEKNRESLLVQILKLFQEKELQVKSITFSRPSLDDVFLKLTGRTLRDS